MFVTCKRGSLMVYRNYDAYSESWEYTGTQFVCTNCILRTYSLMSVCNWKFGS